MLQQKRDGARKEWMFTQDLINLVEKAGLEKADALTCLRMAEQYCDQVGAKSLEDILEHSLEEAFVEALGIKLIPAKRVREALRAMKTEDRSAANLVKPAKPGYTPLGAELDPQAACSP